jgi:hypothetical protein|tara:strand:- start:2210 stop:3880 length:1671 start_codon:yes stop_codon:yes gene_type:complete
MALTLEVSYFNSYYMKRLADVPETSAGPGTATWNAPQTVNADKDWYIEESRIRGGYNNTSTDYGVKAYIVEENDESQRRGNSLIYSGIYNSRTGVNNTNQFSVGESITRSVDPIGGTIQKLYAEDTNLTIFQERKVNVALIDKDAIYSAEGQAMTTSANLVIGQITPVGGNWGIGTNPESFAVYGYTKYFVDKNRNAVLKLAGGQIQEISNAMMIDFFRDKLSAVTSTGVLLGAYDVYNQNYVLSIQPDARYTEISADGTYYTLSFDERSQGWTSFYSYKPEDMFSSQGHFYTTKDNEDNSRVYKHYSNQTRNSFYGGTHQSSIQFVFNPSPNQIKTFQTINYEGTNGWEVTALLSDETGFDASSGNWINHVDTIVQSAGPIGAADLVSSITTNTADGTNGTYNNAAWTTSGDGTGLIINITVAGQEVTAVVVVATGNDFEANDTITIATGVIGGSDNVIITLTASDLNEYSKIYSYDEGLYTENNIQYRAGFDRKQNKYMAVIPNNTQTPIAGEVIFGNSMTGIKAYYTTVTMKTDTTTDPNGLKELFAVSSTFV